LVKDGAVPRKQLDDINNHIKVLQRQYDATCNQIKSNNTSLKKQALAINAQKQGIKAQKRQIEDQINNLSFYNIGVKEILLLIKKST